LDALVKKECSLPCDAGLFECALGVKTCNADSDCPSDFNCGQKITSSGIQKDCYCAPPKAPVQNYAVEETGIAPGVAEELGSGQAIGAFDLRTNTKNALMIGVALVIALVAGIAFLVFRRRPPKRESFEFKFKV
jgi:hypothetical protein